jgi:hypothetical protein
MKSRSVLYTGNINQVIQNQTTCILLWEIKLQEGTFEPIPASSINIVMFLCLFKNNMI